ncbi:MAG: hypothetical protein V3U83_03315 [Acidobacteriota bacterium]
MSSTPGPTRSGSGRWSAASVAVAVLILVLSAPRASTGENRSTPANQATAANLVIPANPTTAPADDRDVVVLLHGLARTPRSMRKLERGVVMKWRDIRCGP